MTRGHRGSLDLRCRALSSLSPCRFIPTLSTRPTFPSPVAPGWISSVFGFPSSFAPRDYSQRTSGRGQVIEHGPEPTLYVIDLASNHALISQCVRPRVARDGATVLRGRCLHYGKGITFWPLVEALLPVGEPARRVLELLNTGGSATPEELFSEVRRLLESLASERPTVSNSRSTATVIGPILSSSAWTLSHARASRKAASRPTARDSTEAVRPMA